MLASEVDVRQLRVAVETNRTELSLLGWLLRCLLCRLLAALFRCLLSTFLSCHKLYVLLLFKIFGFKSRPQDTVLTSVLWARVNGAQHLAI
jgi:hypothetical protein